MRAARIHAYGEPAVLRIEDVERPTPGPREVLIEVHATSVNPIDWKIRRGGMRGLVHYRLPRILGLDVSGVVIDVGRKVRRFRAGDEVHGSPSHRGPGTYAEYTAVDERALAPKPPGMSHVEAAALPLAGLTAWECIVAKGRVKAGDRVLVQAGAGGVGSLAIQIAKARGAWVATTCSAGNVELCRSLGADRVIDYKKERFEDVLEPCDMVLDALGVESLAPNRRVVRRGGRLASIEAGVGERTKRYGPWLGAASAGLWIAGTVIWSFLRYGVIVHHVLRPTDGTKVAALDALYSAGKLHPLIDRVLPLERIVDAHERSESGRARGKIVIALRDDAAAHANVNTNTNTNTNAPATPAGR